MIGALDAQKSGATIWTHVFCLLFVKTFLATTSKYLFPGRFWVEFCLVLKELEYLISINLDNFLKLSDNRLNWGFPRSGWPEPLLAATLFWDLLT
jgi:hypothetical protein